MPHRIPATLRKLQALEALGIAAPPKPFLRFSENLLNGRACTPNEKALDAEYQRQLGIWVSQIAYLYDLHVPQKNSVDAAQSP